MREELEMSIKTSILNSELSSNINYQHSIIYNKNKTMLTELKKQLQKCDEFKFSIAFITDSGVKSILQELIECEKRGVKGQVITGDYLSFSDPKALRQLNSFSNIEVKMSIDTNLHTKGYFFKCNKFWNVLIGSSNLTCSALKTNSELNLKFSAYKDGQIIDDILKYFDKSFSKSLKMSDVIEEYEQRYIKHKQINEYYKRNQTVVLEPNKMQVEALINLTNCRKQFNKGLLISATGTGKTYLSAFDVKQFKAKKLLFIVHRENIAIKAMKSFQNIIKNKNYGLYTGNKRDGDAEYVFATIQTLTRDNHLNKFSKSEFDYIIIDEVHHGGAQTYLKVINYFQPKFLLGMTATPQRNDDFNIYELFDYNIVHEVKLNDAMEMDLLCPFHYFGVNDVTVLNEEITESTSIDMLSENYRFMHVLDYSRKYGYSGKRLNCLIFVSRVEEGLNLELFMNNQGIKTKFLSGANSSDEREKVINEFENGKYNYIITVDIFNEGVDISCVNQIILLRPTQSAIVYIQQLGRGLRKHPEKKFVVVLDFIGSYKNNYLITVALSQKNDGIKDKLAEFIKTPNEYIIGESVVSFEPVVKDRIYKQILNDVKTEMKKIMIDYNELKKRLNRKVFLKDFIIHNKISPLLIVEKIKTIYDLQNKNDENVLCKSYECLKYLSKFFLLPKRVHEIEILNQLKDGSKTLKQLNCIIEEKYKINNQLDVTLNALNYLMFEMNSGYSEFKSYKKLINCKDEFYSLNFIFDEYIEDIIECSLHYLKQDKLLEASDLVEFKMYTRVQAAQISKMKYNTGLQVSGYFFDEIQRKALVFINFDDNSSFTNYDNQLVTNQHLTWYSTSRRTLKKSDGNLTKEGLIAQGYYDLKFFARKNKNNYFYFIGSLDKTIEVSELINDENKNVVKYLFKLKSPIKESIYEYLTEKSDL